MIGKKVKVFWPVDSQWYTGTVEEYNEGNGEHKLCYPDGDEEWVKIGENGANSGASPEQQQQQKQLWQKLQLQQQQLQQFQQQQVQQLQAPAQQQLQAQQQAPAQQQMPYASLPGGFGIGGVGGASGNSNPQSPENRSQSGGAGNVKISEGSNGNVTGNEPYNNNNSTSPSKHPHLYGGGEMVGVAGGMLPVPAGPYNPYSQHPHFMGHPFPPFNPNGYPHPQYDMRTGMQFPPNRMSVSPSRSRGGRGTNGGGNGNVMEQVTSSTSPSHTSPQDTGLTSSGGKKKSGPKTWSKEEDTQLLNMVKKMCMPIKWSLVSQSMPDRTGKQCRERYVNHLNPRLKNCDWSPAEDATIFHLYNTCGSQWAKMSKMIPGRTDNGIKNRFHNLRRQLEREDEHRVRLSKPEDFPDEVQLDRIRDFPDHMKGKCGSLWEMSDGVGVLAAQSVLGGSFARNAGRFGPFKKADPSGEQCARCGLFAPSTHCGTQICTKSNWCIACTRLPPHMCSNILRECLNLRRIQEDTHSEQDKKLIKAGALNLALADAK